MTENTSKDFHNELVAAKKEAHERGYRAAMNQLVNKSINFGWDAALGGQNDLIDYLSTDSAQKRVRELEEALATERAYISKLERRVEELEAHPRNALSTNPVTSLEQIARIVNQSLRRKK